MDEAFLTIQEVMKILQVSRRTIYYWMDSGILNPIRINRVVRFRLKDIEALADPAKPKETKTPSRILVIDDDVLVRESLKMLLNREGFEVTLAQSGPEALEILARESADLIICDIRMPQMNGIETLKAIRETRRKAVKAFIPEILLTGYEDVGARQEAARMGIISFVTKPFELPSFLKEVRHYIK